MSDHFVDLVCVAVCALVGLTMLGEADLAGRLVGDGLFYALVLGVVGVLALWWRRRFPVQVAALLFALLALTDVVIGAVVVAVYTVTAYRRWSVSATVVGLGVALYLPYSVAAGRLPTAYAYGDNIGYLVLVAVAVAAGLVSWNRREALAALTARAAAAEADAALRAERVRVQERQRIAREMHDALAHRISLVSLQAGALEIRPGQPTDDVARTAAAIRSHAHLALEDLRDILGVLRAGTDGADLLPQPTLADLDALIAESGTSGMTVAVDRRLPDRPLPPLLGRTAYRVVQEGLTNARKHAPGAPVGLRLSDTPDGNLYVEVSNPLAGSGGSSAVPGAHSGLVGLAERVSLAGGRFEHGARRTADGAVVFCLQAWLPWPA